MVQPHHGYGTDESATRENCQEAQLSRWRHSVELNEHVVEMVLDLEARILHGDVSDDV